MWSVLRHEQSRQGINKASTKSGSKKSHQDTKSTSSAVFLSLLPSPSPMPNSWKAAPAALHPWCSCLSPLGHSELHFCDTNPTGWLGDLCNPRTEVLCSQKHYHFLWTLFQKKDLLKAVD